MKTSQQCGVFYVVMVGYRVLNYLADGDDASTNNPFSTIICCVMFVASGICAIIFLAKVTHDNYENIQNAIIAEYNDAEFQKLEKQEGSFISENKLYEYKIENRKITVYPVSSGDGVKVID